jgi:hypothetical protein
LTRDTGLGPDITLDSKRYVLARERNELLWRVPRTSEEQEGRSGQLVWANITEDLALGMGDVAYYFGQSVDCTDGKIRISPEINTIAMPGMDNDGWVEFFGAQDAKGADYVFAAFDGSGTSTSVTKIETSTYTIKKTTEILGANNAAPGQHWIFDDSSGASLVYLPWAIQATNAFMELTTVATDASNDTWTTHDTTIASVFAMLGIQDGGVAKLLRIQRDAISACSAGSDPLLEASWSNMITNMGDRTATAMGAVTSGGDIYVAKQDTLWKIDSDVAYAFLDQSLIDRSNPGRLNGRGTWTHGSSRFYYPHLSGLWEISGGVARLDGIDQIQGYTDTPNVTIPRRYYHYGGCSRGDWNYCIYSDQSSNSYIMAFRRRKSGEPTTAVNLWHPIIYRANAVYGIWMDNTSKLWWGEPANDRICYAQMATDGSPNTTTNRGAVNTTYPWYSKIVDFGYPTTLKELHRIDVYTENWPGNDDCTIQAKYLKDGAAASNFGSAIDPADSADTTVAKRWITPSVDGYRFRFQLDMITHASNFVPASDDPHILKAIVYAILRPDKADLFSATIDCAASAALIGGSVKGIRDELKALENADPVTAYDVFGDTVTVQVFAVSDERTVWEDGVAKSFVEVVYREVPTA